MLKKAIIKMEYKKILFEHENAPEGGYGIESAWAIPEGDNFKLTNILFYAPEYSWGDVVSVENREGELFVTGLIQESGHSTVRIIFYKSDEVHDTIEYLISIGCDAEISNIPTLISVDIPAEISYKQVKEFLEGGRNLSKWDYEEACIAHNN
jgi:hypothetical protein